MSRPAPTRRTRTGFHTVAVAAVFAMLACVVEAPPTGDPARSVRSAAEQAALARFGQAPFEVAP